MKEVLKKFLIATMCLTVLSTHVIVTGCTSNKPADGDEPSIETPDSEKKEPTKPIEPTWTTEKFDTFVAKMSTEKNYTSTITTEGQTIIYSIVGDVARVRENGDRRGVYYFEEDGKYYKIQYEESQLTYIRTYSQKFDADSIILNSLNEAVITDYNEDTNQYSGTISGQEFSIIVSTDRMQCTAENTTYDIALGKTTINVPTSYEDNLTEPVTPEKPDDPVNPPVVDENKIFTTDTNGNRVYNYALLAETLKEALNKETNGKTLFTQIERTGTTIESIEYISTSNGIEFGAVTHSAYGTDGFTIFNVSENNFETKEQLINGLVAKQNITGETIDVIQYSSNSDDKTEVQNVLTAAQNVNNRLVNIGIQNRLENSGTRIPELDGGEIVFAYTKGYTNDGVGYGIGYVKYIGVKYIVENDLGEKYFVDTYVITEKLSIATPFEIVVGGYDNRYIVNRATTKKVDHIKANTQSSKQVALPVKMKE